MPRRCPEQRRLSAAPQVGYGPRLALQQPEQGQGSQREVKPLRGRRLTAPAGRAAALPQALERPSDEWAGPRVLRSHSHRSRRRRVPGSAGDGAGSSMTWITGRRADQFFHRSVAMSRCRRPSSTASSRSRRLSRRPFTPSRTHISSGGSSRLNCRSTSRSLPLGAGAETDASISAGSGTGAGRVAGAGAGAADADAGATTAAGWPARSGFCVLSRT